jgi:hypothetical protein
MNCKPGDLAIVKFGSFSGVLVHVLGAAPRTALLLPDRSAEEAAWLVMQPLRTSTSRQSATRARAPRTRRCSGCPSQERR